MEVEERDGLMCPLFLSVCTLFANSREDSENGDGKTLNTRRRRENGHLDYGSTSTLPLVARFLLSKFDRKAEANTTIIVFDILA